jgi:hypothetical protein
MLTKRDLAMSSDRLKDIDSERFAEGKCPVTGEDECHCGDPKKVDEAEFEITYKDPQFTGTRTHTVKAVNAKGAEQKFLSFGNPHKVLDVKKKEKVDEADRPLPQDFVPEPVVAQTIKDLGPGLDPMANGFYDLAYGKLLSNYLAQNTPAIKKKFNMSWNLGWASQMRELYSREYGGYMKTPVKEAKYQGHTLEQLDNVLDTVEELLRELPLDKKEEARLINMLYDMYETAEGASEASAEVDKKQPMYEAHEKLEKLVGQKVYVKNKGQTGTVSMVSPTHSNALVVDMDNGQTTVSHFADLTSEGDKPTAVKRYIDMLKDIVDIHDRGAVPKGGYPAKDHYTNEAKEVFTDEEVQKAIRIAMHMKGDMTDATDAIDAIHPGLSQHTDVADALKKANESLNESTNNVGAMMKILSGIN